MFVVEATDEAAKGERKVRVAGFQMASGMLQEVILLQRCIVVAAKTVLQLQQLGDQGIDRVRREEVAETLQEVAHFFAIDADGVDEWIWCLVSE